MLDDSSTAWMSGLPDPVARRRIYGRIDDQIFAIEMTIFRPERLGRAEYRAKYKLAWRDGQREKYAHGVDSFQALLWTYRMIYAELEMLVRVWEIRLFMSDADARSGAQSVSLDQIFDNPQSHWGARST